MLLLARVVWKVFLLCTTLLILNWHNETMHVFKKKESILLKDLFQKKDFSDIVVENGTIFKQNISYYGLVVFTPYPVLIFTQMMSYTYFLEHADDVTLFPLPTRRLLGCSYRCAL